MKTTSITIRFNNGEIEQGIEALKAFCQQVLNQNSSSILELPAPNELNVIADALLKNWTEKTK